MSGALSLRLLLCCFCAAEGRVEQVGEVGFSALGWR